MDKPKITVSCNFFENKNQPYLDMCLTSLLRQEGVDLEIIVVSGAPENPKLPPEVKLINQPKENSASRNTEVGLLAARKESTLLFVTSDDVILSKYALVNMAAHCQNGKIILNPISNCDLSIMYHARFGVQNSFGEWLDLRPNMRIPDIAGFEMAIMDFPYLAPFPMIFRVPYHNIYATMFRKDVFEDVGGFDDINLRICGEDTDWCIRAEQKGYYCYTTPNAFALHFGGVSTSLTQTPDKIKLGLERFKQKWGIDITKIIPQHLGSYNEHIELLKLREQLNAGST